MGSSSSKPQQDPQPTRQDRQKCWEARDAYFACLDGAGVIKAGEEGNACSKEEKQYQDNCARSWIEYFNQRRVLAEQQKNRLAQGSSQTQGSIR